jgi:hypothetical protein
VSGAAILFLPSESRTEVFVTSSLDRFGIKNILFVTLFFIKRSRLATGLFCLAFEWSGYQMVGTGIKLNSIKPDSSAFGCLLYLEKSEGI